jgi:hypothetical protein
MRWRLYVEEGLAGREASLWLLESTLTVEHAGEPLSAYEVRYDAADGSGNLLGVGKPSAPSPTLEGTLRSGCTSK